MTPNDALEERLRQWSIDGTADFKRTFTVMPGRWLQMEAECGTLGACQRILLPHQDDWWIPVLTHLWEAKRLKWSAEAVALKAEFAPLFTDEERAVARARLLAFEYEGGAE